MSGGTAVGVAWDDRPPGVRQRGRAVALVLLALVAGPLGVVLASAGLWLAAISSAPLMLFVAVPLVLVAVWALGGSLLATSGRAACRGGRGCSPRFWQRLTCVTWVVLPQWWFGW